VPRRGQLSPIFSTLIRHPAPDFPPAPLTFLPPYPRSRQARFSTRSPMTRSICWRRP
jgi:hypothetical protein